MLENYGIQKGLGFERVYIGHFERASSQYLIKQA